MRPLDAVVLAQWVAVHASVLEGARIQKITHPTPRELAITLRYANQTGVLYINIQKTYPVVALTTAEQLECLIQPTFEKATNWCLQLRKHLVGGRVHDLLALPGERVIQLTVTNFNDLGEHESWHLVLELMGRHSNVLLVNGESRQIVGAAHHVSEQMSQHRQIATGLRYVPPPVPVGKVWLGQAPVEELAEALQQQSAAALAQHYSGAGRHTWQDALDWADETSPQHAAETLLDAAQGVPVLVWQPTSDGFRLTPSEHVPEATVVNGWDEGILHIVAGIQLAAVRQQLQPIVARQQSRWQARQDELFASGTAANDAQQAQHWGDVLMTHAATQPLEACPETETVDLLDWETGRLVKLDVEPTQTWRHNAERYYRQGRQIRQREKHQQAQADLMTHEATILSQMQWAIEAATTLPELWAINEDLVALGWRKASNHHNKNQTKGKKDLPTENVAGLLKLTASDGETPIYVGRQGQANSALLSHLSRQEDWWCHAKGYPGAHVVLRHATAADFPEDGLLLDAMHLAAHFSGAHEAISGTGKLPVVYTQRRFVRKIPNSYPGHVTYKQEYEALIEVDPDRVARLLNSSERG